MCPFMRAFGLGVARPSYVPVDCVTYWSEGRGAVEAAPSVLG